MGPLCLSCLPLAWPHWLPPALLPLVPFQQPTMSGAMLETQGEKKKKSLRFSAIITGAS